jgi:tetratricopeptide (TPR) repeat protein
MGLFCAPETFAQDGEPAQDAVAIFNRAQDAHEKGDLAGAIKLYDEAIKVLPDFPEAEYQRATAQFALGNHAEAEKSFRRAIQLRADWTLPMTALGSLLVQKGAFAEAESILKKVIALEPQNPPALTAMIDLKLETKASPAILNELLSQISALTAKANPTVTLWTARASLEDALRKPDAAKKSLSAALALDPKNRNALFQLAGIAVVEGDVVKAKDLAARLEQTAAGGDGVKLLNAQIAAQEGRFGDAIKLLDEIKDTQSGAVELRGKINAMQSGNTADLEKQLEADPKNAGILGRLCTLYRRADPAKALEMCGRASEAEPGNINHAVGFGAALVQAKQFYAAVNLFKKTLEIAPDNATAHANLATALFQLKRMPEAKSEFQWLTNAQPASAGAYLFLGIIHDQLDEYMDAMANYQQYLRLADPVENKLDIDKVNLRIPAVQKLIKAGKGKKIN